MLETFLQPRSSPKLRKEVDAVIKKFFVAMILGLLVMSSQIVSAADVDWSKVPRIGSKAQLANYIEDGRRRGQKEFNFVLTYNKVNNHDELVKLSEELGNRIAPAQDSSSIVPLDDLGKPQWGSGRLTYIIKKEYPGVHVANAYLSRQQDIAWKNLDDEEKLLYSEALTIVNEANKRSSEVEKARYIHDEICKRKKEFRVENDRNKTAVGALIDGYAQCQGYSDAFYMLGRMCGLDVRMIGGSATDKNGHWGLHQWNTITFNDGKTYFVDVTNGNLFKVTYEDIKQTHSWDREIVPNLQ